MKVGIVGGTFNPIHLGHLMLGEYAYKELELDEIWFMPNANPPHKNKKTFTTSILERKEMIELAIKDVPYFQYSTHEVDKKETSYSYRTMSELKAIYPSNIYYFIIGSDSLFSLETWKHPEILMTKCRILVACRSGADVSTINAQIHYLTQKYDCAIDLLEMPLLEISSSEIRNRIKQNKSIKYVVPDSVHSYIKSHHLYTGGN